MKKRKLKFEMLIARDSSRRKMAEVATPREWQSVTMQPFSQEELQKVFIPVQLLPDGKFKKNYTSQLQQIEPDKSLLLKFPTY